MDSYVRFIIGPQGAEGRKQLQEAIDMKRLQQDVQTLKIQVVALQVAASEVVDE